ncbi:hypothetical protein [Hyphomonas sp.]|uniref:hypothetical protein n=1 Tax=Hyphomonas sp. TaxID=87 RepID=UPI0025C4E168|nr:hypothetical protein [Hyphomonas sp.]
MISSAALKDGKVWMMDVVASVEDKRVLRWERKPLPVRYRGSGLATGNVLIVIAAFMAVCPLFFGNDYGAGGSFAAGLFLWPLAGAVLMIGMWVISVSLILREIRLQSFEAAIRGGDLKEVPAPNL